MKPTTCDWQPISTVPLDNKPVLVMLKEPTCIVSRSFIVGSLISTYTHWAPLPEPPKPSDGLQEWWDGMASFGNVEYKCINGVALRIETVRHIWTAAQAHQAKGEK